MFPYDSTKSRKEYLVLTCGPPSLSSATPKAKGEDGVSCSDDESSGDEENKTVSLEFLCSFHVPQPLAIGGALVLFSQ